MRVSIVLISAGLAIAPFSAACAQTSTVEVRLTGARPGGPAMVQLCSEAEGLQECARYTTVPVRNGTATARFSNVPPGRWAVVAFQDVDSNGRLGFGFLGRPNEPWGYSRGAQGVMGPPDFAAAAVAVPASGGVIPVRLGM
jgi:uncharacterized protein (DUF2141 family)